MVASEGSSQALTIPVNPGPGAPVHVTCKTTGNSQSSIPYFNNLRSGSTILTEPARTLNGECRGRDRPCPLDANGGRIHRKSAQHTVQLNPAHPNQARLAEIREPPITPTWATI